MAKKKMKKKQENKQLSNLTLLQIEIKKTIEIAKQLKYQQFFPEIIDKLSNANSENELSNIMCTYRNRLPY